MTYTSLLITQTQDADGRVVLGLVGALDVATAPLAERALSALRTSAVRVDLRELSLLDSTGLATLVHAHHDAATRGGQLEFIAPRGDAARLITRMRLHHLLRFTDPADDES